MLLLVSEFSHLRKDSSSNVEETQHFSMCNIGGKRIPDIRLRPWACSVLLFTRRFISVKNMSNNVIALCFKQLCASKYLKDEFDMVYDTFLADIPDAPEELTTSKSVISKYLYDILLRKLFHSRAAENVNRYKDQNTSRHAAKNNKAHLRTTLKVVSEHKGGSKEGTSSTSEKKSKKRKLDEVAPHFKTKEPQTSANNEVRMNTHSDEELEEDKIEEVVEEVDEEDGEVDGKEDDEEVVETDEVNCNESVSSDADTHEDEDIEWLKSLDDDNDYHNNESKGMLENFTSYYTTMIGMDGMDEY
jgi:hypothetical protein